MKSNYKKLGQYIKQVSRRNSDLSVTDLKGISIDKEFMPSVANVNGTDLSKYRVVQKEEFAYNPMHVGRDEVLPISMLVSEDAVIVSPAYIVFEIIDKNELLPEYLMMWFRRPEFDRNAWFTTDSSVRGGFNWEDFCNMELPVPDIDEQRAIVKEYNTVVNRIKLNEELNKKLEDTAQTIYKQWFVDFEFPIDEEYANLINRPDLIGKPYKSNGGEMVFNEELRQKIPKGWEVKKMDEIISVKDGTHDSPSPTPNGKCLITSKHLGNYNLSFKDCYYISKEDFENINKRSKVDKYDILFSMIGTIGLINYVLYENINFAIKNIGLFKTSENLDIANYILFYLKSDYAQKYLKSSLSGSTQSYITLLDLRNIPVIMANNININYYKTISTKIINYIFEIVKENNKLQETLNLINSRMASQTSEVENG